jgi:hypothetical protein
VKAKEPWQMKRDEAEKTNVQSLRDLVNGTGLQWSRFTVADSVRRDAQRVLDNPSLVESVWAKYATDEQKGLVQGGPRQPRRAAPERVAIARALRNLTVHRRAVEAARAAGKPVPPEVLADYPDLAPNSSATLTSSSGQGTLDNSPLAAMLLPELRAEAARRGLPTTGTKKVLVGRLAEAPASGGSSPTPAMAAQAASTGQSQPPAGQSRTSPEGSSSPKSTPAKEPWEMTAEEFNAAVTLENNGKEIRLNGVRVATFTRPADAVDVKGVYRRTLANALQTGKPVPLSLIRSLDNPGVWADHERGSIAEHARVWDENPDTFVIFQTDGGVTEILGPSALAVFEDGSPSLLADNTPIETLNQKTAEEVASDLLSAGTFKKAIWVAATNPGRENPVGPDNPLKVVRTMLPPKPDLKPPAKAGGKADGWSDSTRPIAESITNGVGRSFDTRLAFGTGTISRVFGPTKQFPKGSVLIENKAGKRERFDLVTLVDRVARGESYFFGEEIRTNEGKALAFASAFELQQDAKSRGLSTEGTREQLAKRIADASRSPTPKPKATPKADTAQPFTRADLDRRISEAVAGSGLATAMQDLDAAVNEQDATAGGQAFSTQFASARLPAEVREWLSDKPQLRRFFKTGVKGGGGEDSMVAMGERYFQTATEVLDRRTTTEAMAQQLRENDPNLNLALWLRDNLPEKQSERPAFGVVDPKALKPGTTLSMLGKPFEVATDSDGKTVLVEPERADDGDELSSLQTPMRFELDGLDAIPVDAGTLNRAGSPTPRTVASAKPKARSWAESIQEAAKSTGDAAQARLDATNKGGKKLYSNGLIDPDVLRITRDTALVLAARAIEGGIKGGRALTELARETTRQIAKGRNIDWKVVRRMAAPLVKAASDPDPEKARDNFERIVAEMRKPTPAKASVKAVREATGQTPAPKTVTEPDALRQGMRKAERAANRAFKEGRLAGIVESIPALRSMEAILKSEPTRIAQAVEIARRGGKDEAKAAQEVKDALREQVNQLAQTMRPEIRGRLMKSIQNVATPVQQRKVIRSLITSRERTRGQAALAKVRKFTNRSLIKSTKGLTADARERLKQLASEAERAGLVLKGKPVLWKRVKGPDGKTLLRRVGDVTLDDIMAATKILDTLAGEAALEITIARNLYKEIKGTRGMTAQAVADAAIKAITAKKEPIDTRGRLVDAALKLPGWLNLNAADMRVILARIEGSGGILKDFIYTRLRDADTRRGAIQRELTQEADKVAKDAGFKDFDDARAQTSSFRGAGATKILDVRVNGETVKLTFGQALDLYGHYTDPSTSALITRGLEAVPEGGEDTAKIAPSPIDAVSLRLLLEAELPGVTKFIDGAKRVANIYFPARQKATYRLTGTMPPDQPGRWRRDRYFSQKPVDKIPANGREYAVAMLENIGTNIERVETTGVPLLLRSPADKLMDDIRETADIVAMAEPIRDVMNVLENQDLKREVSKRHPGVMKALTDLVTATYAVKPVGWGGKVAHFIGRNAAVTMLAANVSSIAVNLTGGIRSLPDLRVQDFMGAQKDVVKNGVSLFKDLKERSGYFHERYNTAAQARVNMIGTSPKEVPAVRSAARALRAMAKNIKAADVGTAYMDLRDATGATLELYNVADAPLSVHAYAAKIRESKSLHKDWTEEQHRDWAAVEAEQIIRDTQPGHGSIDAGLAPVRVRGDFLSAFFMLTSDVFRARNRINLAFHKSNAYGTKVLAAETANIALGIGTRLLVGYAFKAAFLAVMGGDDDDQRKLFEETFEGKGMLKQFALNAASLGVPVVGSQASTIVGGWGGESAAMAPGQRLLSNAIDSATGVYTQSSDALERWLEGRPIRVSRLLRAWAKALNDGTGAVAGNPFHWYIRQAMDAAKRAE